MSMDAETFAATDTLTALRNCFNGDAAAGIGAYADRGLDRSEFHFIPWDPSVLVTARHGLADDVFWVEREDNAPEVSMDSVARCTKETVARWRLDNIASEKGVTDADLVANVGNLAHVIVASIMMLNAYGGECEQIPAAQMAAVRGKPAEELRRLMTQDRLIQAITLIFAKGHTKYQTNHCMGGSPAQASVASCIRAFFPGLDIGSPRYGFVYEVLYRALHPVSDTYVIPAVIARSGIRSTLVHAGGPQAPRVRIESYFRIRRDTPPAGTHHIAVLYRALARLDEYGILPALPGRERIRAVATEFRKVLKMGARAHPAAAFWGLEPAPIDQKVFDDMLADAGYGIQRLFPTSTLADSPMFRSSGEANAQWKRFIDSLALYLRGQTISEDDIASVMQAVLPGLRAGRSLNLSIDLGRAIEDPSSAFSADSEEETKDVEASF